MSSIPDLDGLDYNAEKLQDLWDHIQALLEEQGGLCGKEMVEELDWAAIGYQKSTIRADILPAMREPLEDQGFIHVDLEPGDDGRIMEKVWVLVDDD